MSTVFSSRTVYTERTNQQPQRGRSPYSLFKVAFPWWRSALLNLFNLCLSWSDVPMMWKHSVVVPVFKTGDHSTPSNYRPISLASCCFKVLEHMVHSRILPPSPARLTTVATFPGRFPIGCRRDGWLSDRRVAHAVDHPHLRCVRGHPQSVRHLFEWKQRWWNCSLWGGVGRM